MSSSFFIQVCSRLRQEQGQAHSVIPIYLPRHSLHQLFSQLLLFSSVTWLCYKAHFRLALLLDVRLFLRQGGWSEQGILLLGSSQPSLGDINSEHAGESKVFAKQNVCEPGQDITCRVKQILFRTLASFTNSLSLSCRQLQVQLGLQISLQVNEKSAKKILAGFQYRLDI